MLVEDSKYRAAAQLLRQAQEIRSRNDVDAYLQAVERAAKSQGTLNK
jgi:hypothetical protein